MLHEGGDLDKVSSKMQSYVLYCVHSVSDGQALSLLLFKTVPFSLRAYWWTCRSRISSFSLNKRAYAVQARHRRNNRSQAFCLSSCPRYYFETSEQISHCGKKFYGDPNHDSPSQVLYSSIWLYVTCAIKLSNIASTNRSATGVSTVLISHSSQLSMRDAACAEGSIVRFQKNGIKNFVCALRLPNRDRRNGAR